MKVDAYHDVTVDVVEIDPVVIDVAKKYFGVNASDTNNNQSRLKIYNEDVSSYSLIISYFVVQEFLCLQSSRVIRRHV